MRRGAFVLIVLLLAGCGGSKHATFANPVFDRDFPGLQVQTATSKDLVHWVPGPDALPKLGYSGGNYQDDTYAVGYATCKTPLGPCTDAPENPILKTACRAHGPGHNALIEVHGQTWIVYHAWRPNHRGDARVLWIDKLDWKNGKPVVEGPTCTPQSMP